MQKRLNFIVEIEFEGDVVTDEEILEVRNNVLKGLVSWADGEGLAPAESDTFTKHIRVTPQYLNETAIHSF